MIVEGIQSGDLECWCLLVTKETFKKLMGNAPDKEIDVGRFAKKGSKYRYKIYPSALFGQDRTGLAKEENDVFVISVDAVKKASLDK